MWDNPQRLGKAPHSADSLKEVPVSPLESMVCGDEKHMWLKDQAAEAACFIEVCSTKAPQETWHHHPKKPLMNCTEPPIVNLAVDRSKPSPGVLMVVEARQLHSSL